jgi:hypothetical protein
LENKLGITGLLVDKKQKRKCGVFAVEKLDDKGARLEHTSRKSLEELFQDTGVLESNASRATQLLKR